MTLGARVMCLAKHIKDDIFTGFSDSSGVDLLLIYY